jgi:hypothetical protein
VCVFLNFLVAINSFWTFLINLYLHYSYFDIFFFLFAIKRMTLYFCISVLLLSFYHSHVCYLDQYVCFTSNFRTHFHESLQIWSFLLVQLPIMSLYVFFLIAINSFWRIINFVHQCTTLQLTHVLFIFWFDSLCLIFL